MLTEQGVATLEGSTVFDVKSAVLDDTLRITVAPPRMYDAFRSKLPTIYVLDGNLCLPIATSIAHALQFLAFGVLAPVICVGIGYATDDPLEVMALRTRDMTPTEGTLPSSPLPMGKYGMGGAGRFLDAVTEDVIPLVEDRWRADPADRCLVGWSFGGLLGLHALFTRPEMFSRYMLVSPSIWWSDRAVLLDEESYAKAHEDLAAKVFCCVGEREETAPSRMWPPQPAETAGFAMEARMVSALDDLVARLRSRHYPSLSLTHEVFENEHHVTVFPAAFTRGLVSLYSTTVET